MSYHALEWAVGMNMTPADKVVLLVLAWHANFENVGFPSVRTIAEETGYSTRTIRRAIKRFIDQGLMETRSTYGVRGRQTVNEYRLFVGQAPVCLLPLGVTTGCQGEGDTGVTPRGDITVSPLELTEEVKKEVRDGAVDNSGGEAGMWRRRAELWPKTPASLRRGERASVVRLLDEVPRDDAALLIDELHGALRAKAITGSPVRWFEGLLRKYRQDKFRVHYSYFEFSNSKGKRLDKPTSHPVEGREGFLRVKKQLLSRRGEVNGE